MKFFFFIAFTLIAVLGFGQRVCISNPEQRILYSDFLRNPLDILVEGYSYNSLIITTNNGRIENPDSSAVGFYKHYYWIDQLKNGTATITVNVKVGKKIKKIGFFNFQVEYWPFVKFAIGASFFSNLLKKNNLVTQDYVRAEYFNTYINARLQIDSFNVVAFRDHQVLFYETNYSNKLSDSIKSLFQTLQKGDQLLFFNIYSNFQHHARKLEDEEIIITE